MTLFFLRATNEAGQFECVGGPFATYDAADSSPGAEGYDVRVVGVPFDTRERIKAELADLRRRFRASGGRGVDLADRIDFYSSILRRWRPGEAHDDLTAAV